MPAKRYLPDGYGHMYLPRYVAAAYQAQAMETAMWRAVLVLLMLWTGVAQAALTQEMGRAFTSELTRSGKLAHFPTHAPHSRMEAKQRSTTMPGT